MDRFYSLGYRHGRRQIVRNYRVFVGLARFVRMMDRAERDRYDAGWEAGARAMTPGEIADHHRCCE